MKVDDGRPLGKPHTKFASAQDLRRAFCLRWLMRVMLPVLLQLMRHGSIDTTLRYDVGQDTEATIVLLWQTVRGHTSGDFSRNR